jgi:hypothetical protein
VNRLLSCGAQVRIMLSVLQFRLNKRYVEADPPFVSIELDQSDSGREGCAVSTLTITSEPADWQGAVQARARPPGSLQCQVLDNIFLCTPSHHSRTFQEDCGEICICLECADTLQHAALLWT